MEEEKVVTADVEQTEKQEVVTVTDDGDSEQSPHLTKDEILARSRKENKRGDERAERAMLKAGYLAMFVGGLVCAVIYFLFQLILGEYHHELFLVYDVMWAVFTWVQYYYIRRNLHLGCAIAFTVAGVGFLILLILQLAGIM